MLQEQGTINKGPSIQAVSRTLDVLDILGTGEYGVGQIARALNVNKSTASRLLAILASRDFILRSQATGAYRLGPRIAQLHEAYLRSLRDAADAHYALRRVATDTRETVLLTLYENGQAVYVNKVESQLPLKTSSRIGAIAPLHAGAAGKAILAFQPPDVVEHVLAAGRLARFTANTITTRRALLAELARIREEGYSVSAEEINDGVVGIGMPLLAPDGLSYGSISVTLPKTRFTTERLVAIANALRSSIVAWLGPVPTFADKTSVLRPQEHRSAEAPRR